MNDVLFNPYPRWKESYPVKYWVLCTFCRRNCIALELSRDITVPVTKRAERVCHM